MEDVSSWRGVMGNQHQSDLEDGMEQSFRDADLEMSDTKITCVDCDTQFLYSLGEQQFFREKGLSNPKRCPDCRAERKKEREKKA